MLGCLDAFLLTPAAVYYVALVLGALAPARWGEVSIRLPRRSRWMGVAAVMVLTGLPLYQTVQRTRATHLVGSWFKPIEDPDRLARATAIDPGNYEAHLLLGQHLVRQGRCDLAEPHLAAAGRLFPTAPVLGRLRGRCPL
ncbi:MAG TPA: tetratricopeptide repeat protein [Longimicrobiaceae bacterium]|nr:tetratricopeptide repeat protein [Longimicrobiaceae bacterium]